MSENAINWNDPKFKDPMEEIHAIRRMISEEYGFDVRRYGASVREDTERARALGMTYGEYYRAQFEGTLPLCAGEPTTEYDPKVKQ